jgi:rhodanese-related sulfurtransferase
MNQCHFEYMTVGKAFMTPSIETITKEELLPLLDNDRLVLIDLRLNWLIGRHKIRSAVHEEAHDLEKSSSKYNKEEEIVLYCSTPQEKTSRSVALKMLQIDFKQVSVLRGGWAVWDAANLPVERKTMAPTPHGFIGKVLSDCV